MPGGRLGVHGEHHGGHPPLPVVRGDVRRSAAVRSLVLKYAADPLIRCVRQRQAAVGADLDVDVHVDRDQVLDVHAGGTGIGMPTVCGFLPSVDAQVVAIASALQPPSR